MKQRRPNTKYVVGCVPVCCELDFPRICSRGIGNAHVCSMHETRRRDASSAYARLPLLPGYHTNTARSHSIPPPMAMDNSHRRRYTCSCKMYHNDPRHKQPLQMINIHWRYNGTPESTAYKHMSVPRRISTEHKSTSDNLNILQVPEMAICDGERAEYTGGDGTHCDGLLGSSLSLRQRPASTQP